MKVYRLQTDSGEFVGAGTVDEMLTCGNNVIAIMNQEFTSYC